jgi:hypothetical protein
LTEDEEFHSFKDIFEILTSLNLSIYTPFKFILPQKIKSYEDKYDTNINGNGSLKQSTRETGIMKLMRVLLLKRLESSIHSFKLTLKRLDSNFDITLKIIQNYKDTKKSVKLDSKDFSNLENDDDDDEILNNFSIGKKIKIEIGDMDYISWERALKSDKKIIVELLKELEKITIEKDSKLTELKNIIKNKIENPININNKKIIIFSAFSETIDYLYENLNKDLKKNFNLESAFITGTKNKTTLEKVSNDMNEILTRFSPISKTGNCEEREIDILFATDCISEGQNLQDCDFLVNYDIHWNPVRIIQRFGRIDRIGSKNDKIQLLNFWPPVALDEYLKLKNRVESRMIAGNLSGGGEKNIISDEDKDNIEDLKYRSKQLKKLKEEAIDLEDIGGNISITDLGLNDFKSDLFGYFTKHGKMDNVPFGIHSICDKQNFKEGVIFIMKNISSELKIDNMNRLHPFYLVYISITGEIIYDYTYSKKILDIIKKLSKNNGEIENVLTKKFNKETEEGFKMKKYSNLLQKAVNSIMEEKEVNDNSSLFKSGGTTIGDKKISGIENFELISFLVLK